MATWEQIISDPTYWSDPNKLSSIRLDPGQQRTERGSYQGDFNYNTPNTWEQTLYGMPDELWALSNGGSNYDIQYDQTTGKPTGMWRKVGDKTVANYGVGPDGQLIFTGNSKKDTNENIFDDPLAVAMMLGVAGIGLGGAGAFSGLTGSSGAGAGAVGGSLGIEPIGSGLALGVEGAGTVAGTTAGTAAAGGATLPAAGVGGLGYGAPILSSESLLLGASPELLTAAGIDPAMTSAVLTAGGGPGMGSALTAGLGAEGAALTETALGLGGGGLGAAATGLSLGDIPLDKAAKAVSTLAGTAIGSTQANDPQGPAATAPFTPMNRSMMQKTYEPNQYNLREMQGLLSYLKKDPNEARGIMGGGNQYWSYGNGS